VATEEEVKALRDQIARLIGEKVQLENRVIELERDRAEMAVEGLAAAAVRSVRSAEDAMEAEAPGSNFRVPELEVTVRGYVAARDDTVLLRLPRPELTVPPEHLGTIRMLAVGVPAASKSVEPASDSRLPLVGVLQDAQSAFSGWPQRAGGAAAREIMDRSAELSSMIEDLSSTTAQAALRGLADAATRFGNSLARAGTFAGAKDFRASAGRLAGCAKAPGDPDALAGALRELVRCFQSVRKKQAKR
jgi:hypothetical protein